MIIIGLFMPLSFMLQLQLQMRMKLTVLRLLLQRILLLIHITMLIMLIMPIMCITMPSHPQGSRTIEISREAVTSGTKALLANLDLRRAPMSFPSGQKI